MSSVAAPFTLGLLAVAAALSNPRIEQWRREIEARGGGRIVVVEVETSADQQEIAFPADTPYGAVLRRYFLEESFTAQFLSSHALNINYFGPEGRLHFVVLNLARSGEWRDHGEALLGHELGHAWLYVSGFRSPEYSGTRDACLAIHAGDIVQHILIRQELAGRGIPYEDYWMQNLEQALERLESGGPGESRTVSRCDVAQRLAMWADVRLGLSPGKWPSFGRFDAVMRRAFPALAPVVEEIESRLGRADVRRRTVYRLALEFVSERLAAAAGF